MEYLVTRLWLKMLKESLRMEESSRELIFKHNEADELFIIVPGDEGEIVTYTDDID